jgi:hypothetical protein
VKCERDRDPIDGAGRSGDAAIRCTLPVPHHAGGQLDAYAVGGSSPPNGISMYRQLDARQALEQYHRTMSREARRLWAALARLGSRIPYSLTYRSWPIPDAELWMRLPSDLSIPLAFAEMTREAPIFILDRETLLDVVESGAESSEPWPLPPLPFESIIIETTPLNMGFGQAGCDIHLEATCIKEVERGELWSATSLVYLTQRALSEDPTQRGEYRIICVHHYADGTFEWGVDGELEATAQPAWAAMLVEAVHLITARSVTRGLPDRAVRREYERASGTKWPQNAWQLTIGGENGGGESGDSGRRLTCRFFVRGHWARLPDGNVPSGRVQWRETADRFEVWREAFIKGPAGAPWRSPKHPVRVKPGPGGSDRGSPTAPPADRADHHHTMVVAP